MLAWRRTALSLISAIMMGLLLAQVTIAPAVAQVSSEEAQAERIADAVTDAALNEDRRDAKTGLPREVLNASIDKAELDLRLIPLTKAELELLSAEWLEIVRKKTEEVMAAQVAISKTDGMVEDAARASLTDLTLMRKDLFEKFNAVIAAFEKKGGDPALIADYRAYRSSVIIEETRTSDFKTLLAEAFSWVRAKDGGRRIAINGIVIVGSLISLLFFARIVRGFVRRWISRVPNLSKLLQVFLVTLIYWLVLTFGLLIVLSALGIDISPVFALIGGASFIMAFAFQDTLGNLASGLMIMLNRPFDEGHYVEIGGVSGTVRAVSIVATTVVTADNQVVVIPNKNVWGNVITNATASSTRRVDLVFGISYEDSITDALKVIADTVKAHPLVLEDPEPLIKVHQLADSSVNFICRPWTNTPDYWTVYWDLTQQMKENFDAAGISIPYPQQDVHTKSA